MTILAAKKLSELRMSQTAFDRFKIVAGTDTLKIVRTCMDNY